MHRHYTGHTHDARYWLDVTDEIKTKLIEKRRVDSITCADQKVRITVRGRAHDSLGGDIAVRAWPVFNHEWLAESFRQPSSHQTCGNVVSAACGEADNYSHGSSRVALLRCHRRHNRQRDSTHCKIKELSTGKFHGGPNLQTARTHVL